MEHRKKSGGFGKWNRASRDDNNGTGNIDRALREMEEMERSRQKPVEQKRPTEEKQSPPQIIIPDSSSNDEPLPELFLTEAFTRAGYVNWAGYLAGFPFFDDPSSMECAVSASKEEDGWKIRRHARFMGRYTWDEHLVTLPKETDPLIIKNGAVAYAIRAAEQAGAGRRIPNELYRGAEPNISDKHWPYLTPVFMDAGRVLHLNYKENGVSFTHRRNTACALLIRPLLKKELKPEDPVPNNIPWEVTRFVLSGSTLRPETPRILREGLHQSQVLDGTVSWMRSAKEHSYGKLIMPGDMALKDLSAKMLLVDTCLNPKNLTRDRTATAPNPPSQ